MSKPIIQLTHSFDEWRQFCNIISNNVGDPNNISPDQTFSYNPNEAVISTLNDLYTKKYNKSGGNITGNFSVNTNKFTIDSLSGNTAIAGTFTVSGATTLSNTANIVGNFSVNTNKFNVTATSGNTAIAGTLNTVGDFSVNTNKFNVTAATGNTAIAGTLSVVGNTTLNTTQVSTFTATGSGIFNTTLNVVGNFSVNTNKFNVTATSGNTAIAGTLNVTGVTTLSNSLVSTLGTITTSKPILDATQTWNNSATAFVGIKANITNTASSVSSKLLEFQLAGVDKFTIDVNGHIHQSLAGTYLSRTIFSGARGVREYQDLTDDGRQGLPGVAGISTDSFEWGFTWNAKWDAGTSSYIKDRANANDHAFMFRLHKKYGNQWWFSDGTTANSPISWVKKVDFDFPSNTYTFKDNANETIITPVDVTTSIVKATDKLIVGSISYFDSVEISTTTTTPTIIASFPIGTYRSATFEIQAVDTIGGKFHKTNLSFVHNGTLCDSVEYGSINIGGTCASYSTQLNAGNVEIIATPSSANNTVYKIHVRLMGV